MLGVKAATQLVAASQSASLGIVLPFYSSVHTIGLQVTWLPAPGIAVEGS